ncbi:ornithine carbamoyltransferase [Oceanospirillaceae bacterium]|jgi:ornithine carbamoyltransferase|nr:ornithine carbamoyltransferase [Oceanospirillaceae bacterium]MBT5629303.1 ornithine carbamoyltransferase [Oceanospirillaceae bacterium]MBT6102244.1 ornithine carbamoyltransferase [Oceanospirillaceae bacterium]MBT7673847.1 ornithine carbamoyltransferase [Oceanospirillaceae bacterium]MDB0065173.1 ornithine carbamoyltransferase [Oceanospirillaceae bacterium]
MSNSSPRHFLTLLDLNPSELNWIIQRAIELKKIRTLKTPYEPFRNLVLGMIFEKSSTRTRVSFEAGMAQLGGQAIFLSSNDTQLGRGEPITDSARVISSMVDIVMIRTFSHTQVEAFAAHSRVPVINALTDDYHPCQLLADVQTFVEHRGSIKGKTVTWIGDGNNMCHSFINAARQFDFKLNIACPDGYLPNAQLMAVNADRVQLIQDPKQAVKGSHLVVTDTWASMGQEDEKKARAASFENYQVNPALMNLADPEALFMHCLPAYRGLEISHDMFNDPRSVVFDEAENRLHAQKALMEFLLLNPKV